MEEECVSDKEKILRPFDRTIHAQIESSFSLPSKPLGVKTKISNFSPFLRVGLADIYHQWKATPCSFSFFQIKIINWITFLDFHSPFSHK